MAKFFLSKEFNDNFTYDKTDLGATWKKEKTTFKVWAPTASEVSLVIFKTSSDSYNDVRDKMPMSKGDKGVWCIEIAGDLDMTYYAYEVVNYNERIITQDPYAKSAGVNGIKSMVIAMSRTNPDGWDEDKRCLVENITDATIYEVHVRDFSIYPDSGIENKGKYLAFTQKGTKTSKGYATGLDYLKEMNITHVHLLPTYDFGSVNENTCIGYNWGYDPVNYNVIEGSYSTDPSKGHVRENEFKQMIMSLHNEGIGVILDVVYNHTYNEDFCFNKIVPGYFYRKDSNGTGCGNDVASERKMVSKFIVDSVVYLAKEYHIDGFRFDLMGILDVKTMNKIREELNKIDSRIMIYGEGWELKTKPDTKIELAIMSNSSKTKGIAYFSDTIRDGLRGSVFKEEDRGYATGDITKKDEIISSITGMPKWATNPCSVINYDSCHDNMTIWDRIQTTCSNDTKEDMIKYNKLSAAIVFTSQGVPFMMAGEEFLRTKVDENNEIVENSYKSSDKVNMLDYSRAEEYRDVVEYYKGLINFRKEHKLLRMMKKEEVQDALTIRTKLDKGVIAYELEDENESILVIYNPCRKKTKLSLKKGEWNVYIDGQNASSEALRKVKGSVIVEGLSCCVLVKKKKGLAYNLYKLFCF